jgi:transposase-like protein
MDKKTKMLSLAKDWYNSGITRVMYAQQHGVTESSLEYWCRKLKNQINIPMESEKKINIISKPSFIEIGSNTIQDSINRHAQMELELASGIRIKIY